MLSTWVEDSWPRRCGTTRASSAWNAPTPSRLDPSSDDPIALPERVALAVADVSFISLTRLLRGIAHWVAPGGAIVPDGEAAVRARARATSRAASSAIRRRRAVAVARVREHAEGLGLTCLGEVESPLVGPSGNHEFFLHLRVAGSSSP